MRPPRRLIGLQGAADETAAAAERLIALLPDAACLWVGEGTAARAGVDAAGVRDRLGLGYDAVVVSLHGGVDPDLLALASGFVWAGGALILRLGPVDAPPPAPALAVSPHGEGDVGRRFWRRLHGWLAAHGERDPAPVGPGARPAGGTPEQDRVVAELVAALSGEAPARLVLTADRGRGKSSALGRAIAALPEGLRVAVTAESEAAVAEVVRFAGGRARHLAPEAVLEASPGWDVIVVDEAARLAVPWLQRLVAAHPAARIAFATTIRGYEGTGRGFALRFLRWLAAQDPAPVRRTLEAPIRFAPDDPLERAVFALLALDAEPAAAPARPAPVSCGRVDRDALAADEPELRGLFGLLVHAHYRTTPGDLHRLLDAPNLAVYAARAAGAVVGASLVAAEGGLSPEVCDGLRWGRARIRGHALPETIVVHLGHPEAGALRMWRSVRIASHPDLRRLGVGSALAEAVHAAAETAGVDLVGTLFGATPELVRWRRTLGYELVRVGVSRGSRTGEPAAVMVRPRTEAARALVATLRAELARDLPLQLALLAVDSPVPPSPALEAALLEGLPAPAPLDDLAAALRTYVDGPRPYDAVATAVTRWVSDRRAGLAALAPADRALIEARVVRREPWRAVARHAPGGTVPAAMRALRRAIRSLLAHDPVDRGA